MQKLFSQANIKQTDIDFFAIHPGGVRILEACESALNISAEQNKVSYDILRKYGNMSSVTIFFMLERYMRIIKPSDKGKKLLACAFGPGLTMEALIAEAG